MNMYKNIIEAYQKKSTGIAILIDPEKETNSSLEHKISLINQYPVDYIFVGGSLITIHIDDFILKIKALTDKPVILFPGSVLHISRHVDALLFLSLISSRNPEYLIGNQVLAAPIIKSLEIEAISTGYILIENGAITSVEYMSNSKPIPREKTDIVVATAAASEMIGHKLLYLECGSGATEPVPLSMVKRVKQEISIPILVGGGIKTPDQALALKNAGADIVILGTILEKNPELIQEFVEKIKG